MKNPRPSSLAVLAAVAVHFLMVGCTDPSPTEPRMAAVVTPTPTPAPPPPGITIAGAWTGTFRSDNIEICTFDGIPAQATLQQDGSAVRGTLNAPTAPCMAVNARSFTGTLQGNSLVGTDGTFGSVQGSLGGTTLEIRLGVNPYGYPSEGVMELHR